VTSVDDELFMLLVRENNQVAVYSLDDYKLLRHLNVPRYEPRDDSDMTSCVRSKCLYMSDYVNNCIHRHELASSATIKWEVPGKPCGLSVTTSCNLLVTCQRWGENKLSELNAESGQCVREIPLDMGWSIHSVQLATGHFAVCHGRGETNLHRVCVVGDDGKVARRYGDQCGSKVGQLYNPCHLAVDEASQFIFVADSHNDRVVLLTPTLVFVCDVIEGLSFPDRIHFHQATRRLFVGEYSGRTTIIQL